MRGAEAGVTRLVFCDRHDASWVDEALVAGPSDGWDLLLAGVSAEAYRRRFSRELARLPGLRVIDTSRIAPEVQAEVAAYVLDLVARLPAMPLDGTALGERLRFANANLWWSLEITEKSSFRGLLVERLFRLGLLDRVLSAQSYQEVWVRVTDGLLAGAIAGGAGTAVREQLDRRPTSFGRRLLERSGVGYWLRAIRAAVSLAAVRLLLAANRVPVAPVANAVALFTMYPYWWLRPYDEQAADRFFSAPPSRAYQYVAWLTPPAALWRHRHALFRELRRRQILPLQGLLNTRDALSMLDPRRYLALARVGASLDRLRVRFTRFEVSAIVVDELRRSLADAEIFLDELLGRAIRRLSQQPLAAILYRAEGQPWESALVANAKTTTIGFFHSPFGRNYPALRFAPADSSHEASPVGRRPLPDGALVCGEITRRYMEEDGYPSDRIAACGPQRHAGFMSVRTILADRVALRQRLGLPLGAAVYFVSLAIVEVETEGLFTCLEAALAGRDQPHLLIKTHPNRPAGDPALQAALASAGESRVTVLGPSDDMYAYLAASDAMITIGSTVAFEAMALGVMPIVYEHSATYAATSLRAFSNALFVVDTPDSLRAALEAVDSGGPAAAERRAAWPAAIRQVFGDMETPLSTQLDAALAQLGV